MWGASGLGCDTRRHVSRPPPHAPSRQTYRIRYVSQDIPIYDKVICWHDKVSKISRPPETCGVNGDKQKAMHRSPHQTSNKNGGEGNGTIRRKRNTLHCLIYNLWNETDKTSLVVSVQVFRYTHSQYHPRPCSGNFPYKVWERLLTGDGAHQNLRVFFFSLSWGSL